MVGCTVNIRAVGRGGGCWARRCAYGWLHKYIAGFSTIVQVHVQSHLVKADDHQPDLFLIQTVSDRPKLFPSYFERVPPDIP